MHVYAIIFTQTQEMEAVPPQCDPEAMDGEATLFIAYTSGTQMGTSKAVYHTQAGYLLYTKLTFKVQFAAIPDRVYCIDRCVKKSICTEL